MEWGAERMELANTQYYGWALRNRRRFCRTAELLAPRSGLPAVARRAVGRVELSGCFRTTSRVSEAMHGRLGSRIDLTVAPGRRGCPVRWRTSHHRTSRRVRDHDLAWIWRESPAFNAYRGDAPGCSEPAAAAIGGSRLRRLSVPGVHADRRRGPAGPGVCPLTRSSPGHHTGGRGGQGRGAAARSARRLDLSADDREGDRMSLTDTRRSRPGRASSPRRRRGGEPKRSPTCATSSPST